MAAVTGGVIDPDTVQHVANNYLTMMAELKPKDAMAHRRYTRQLIKRSRELFDGA